MITTSAPFIERMRKFTGILLVVLLPVGKVGHRVGKMRETGRLKAR
ncbi:MAG: hypothetical protein IKJ10_04380 [Bacteroidaceae bacterium]|nr:hypothetical protein [Bacteroidaceae bacterium]